jgi:hypothetical protein
LHPKTSNNSKKNSFSIFVIFSVEKTSIWNHTENYPNVKIWMLQLMFASIPTAPRDSMRLTAAGAARLRLGAAGAARLRLRAAGAAKLRLEAAGAVSLGWGWRLLELLGWVLLELLDWGWGLRARLRAEAEAQGCWSC